MDKLKWTPFIEIVLVGFLVFLATGNGFWAWAVMISLKHLSPRYPSHFRSSK